MLWCHENEKAYFHIFAIVAINYMLLLMMIMVAIRSTLRLYLFLGEIVPDTLFKKFSGSWQKRFFLDKYSLSSGPRNTLYFQRK
jgi:hypothetical protein